MIERYQGYYAAKFAREKKLEPADWVIVPVGHFHELHHQPRNRKCGTDSKNEK